MPGCLLDVHDARVSDSRYSSHALVWHPRRPASRSGATATLAGNRIAWLAPRPALRVNSWFCRIQRRSVRPRDEGRGHPTVNKTAEGWNLRGRVPLRDRVVLRGRRGRHFGPSPRSGPFGSFEGTGRRWR